MSAIDEIRAVLEWQASEVLKASDWYNPEGRIVGVSTRAFNRIDDIASPESQTGDDRG